LAISNAKFNKGKVFGAYTPKDLANDPVFVVLTIDLPMRTGDDPWVLQPWVQETNLILPCTQSSVQIAVGQREQLKLN